MNIIKETKGIDFIVERTKRTMADEALVKDAIEVFIKNREIVKPEKIKNKKTKKQVATT
ncbi:MAG: hypothetical protein IPN29_17080 [Saprospiraceae bacterium]|nr:hypothetical protein [Saprospiraceae bacterium]